MSARSASRGKGLRENVALFLFRQEEILSRLGAELSAGTCFMRSAMPESFACRVGKGAEVGRWLWDERGLKLRHPEARVLSCAGHLDALGHRLTRQNHRPLPRSWRRFRGRLHDALHGYPGPSIRESVTGTLGMMLASTGG